MTINKANADQQHAPSETLIQMDKCINQFNKCYNRGT